MLAVHEQPDHFRWLLLRILLWYSYTWFIIEIYPYLYMTINTYTHIRIRHFYFFVLQHFVMGLLSSYGSHSQMTACWARGGVAWNKKVPLIYYWATTRKLWPHSEEIVIINHYWRRSNPSNVHDYSTTPHCYFFGINALPLSISIWSVKIWAHRGRHSNFHKAIIALLGYNNWCH